MEQRFVRASELAKMLDITQSAAWRLARDGHLPAECFVRLNERTLRFDVEAIQRWIASGEGAKKRAQAA